MFPLYSHTVSDDNSSIQSSPWQRDHSWKQARPRRNISKEMCIYYYRPLSVTLSPKTSLLAKRKRRRPYDTKLDVDVKKNETTNQKSPNDKESKNVPKEKVNRKKSLKVENVKVKEEISEDSVDGVPAVEKSKKTKKEEVKKDDEDQESKKDVKVKTS